MYKSIWVFVMLFCFVSLFSSFDLGPNINPFLPALSVGALFIAAFLHCMARYRLKNALFFFVVVWIISHFFEALSIKTGFPFGHYYYDQLIGPRLFQVPLIIMFAYFGMGYLSWMLSHIILRQFAKPLSGRNIFFVPFVATFIMVMWDLSMDPLSSTISSYWVWKEGGPYFGVPLQNYFGWFLVVYIFFQIFAFWIAKFDPQRPSKGHSKLFWALAVILYGIQGAVQVLYPFTIKEHPEISSSMALVTIFTMLFVTLISFIIIFESDR